MSLKICTAEYMLSNVDGLGMRRNFFRRPVAEVFLESTRDGEIKISPDPVTMIDGDLTYFNNSPDPQQLYVEVHRAPRTIVAQNPSTVVIHDAWSHRVGRNPTAEYPSVIQDTFGGRMQLDRSSTEAKKLKFGRMYLDGDDSQAVVNIGVVPAQQAMHFRYLAAVQTPGVWITPSEFEARWEAYARWTRLVAVASPVVVP